ELESLRKPLFESGLQRVVVGQSGGTERVNAGVKNRAAIVRGCNRAPRTLHRPPGCRRYAWIRRRLRLIAVEKRIKLRALRPTIGQSEHARARQLFFDAEVPLLHVGRAQVLVNREEDGRIRVHQSVGWKAGRQCRYTRNSAVQPRRVSRGRAAWRHKRLIYKKRWVEPRARIQIRSVPLPAIKDAVTRSQHRLRNKLPG